MTTEPRQEAERIVTSYDNVVGSANYRARVAVRDPLVDALAAAIEWDQAKRDYLDAYERHRLADGSGTTTEDVIEAGRRADAAHVTASRALSALREDET